MKNGNSLLGPLNLGMSALGVNIDLGKLEDEATHNSRQLEHRSHLSFILNWLGQ